MKILTLIAFGVLLAGIAHAEFRTWTREDGRTAELDLVSVSESGGEKSGEFKMRNGRSVTLNASSLTCADAKILSDWKPSGAEQGKPSVYDKILDGNLIKLSGKALKPCNDATKPTKYYLFYYTASWCGPCHRFTPSLVDFYNKHKKDTGEFELILVSSDRDEKSMEKYAEGMKMPWPQLKLSFADKFKKEFKHPGTGIPNLVLTDTEGKVLKTSYEGSNYVGPTVVMNHLATLLKQ